MEARSQFRRYGRLDRLCWPVQQHYRLAAARPPFRGQAGAVPSDIEPLCHDPMLPAGAAGGKRIRPPAHRPPRRPAPPGWCG